MSGAPRFTTAPNGQARLLIKSAADLVQAITINERAGSIGMATLFRGLRDGRCAVLPALPEISATAFKAFVRGTGAKPAIFVIPDDDGYRRGPAGWPVAERAIRWAASIILHAAMAEVAHYETAIRAAQVVRRLLIIETETCALEQWLSLVQRVAPRVPLLLIAPENGRVHPTPPSRENLQ